MEIEVVIYLLGMGLMLAACLLVVLYLRAPLERVLEDLCGTRERARFWAVFTHISLTLTPLIFAMSYQPDLRVGRVPIFELTNQLRLGLAGLVFSVLVMGLMISRFIPPPAVLRKRLKNASAIVGTPTVPPLSTSPAEASA